MVARIISTVCILIGLFIFPWWVSALVALAALFYFPRYIEVVFIAVVIDGLYGHVAALSFLPYIATVIALVFYILVQHVRSRLIMY